MNGGQLPTKQLSTGNWGALDHASYASHAPQLLADNYYIMYIIIICSSVA